MNRAEREIDKTESAATDPVTRHTGSETRAHSLPRQKPPRKKTKLYRVLQALVERGRRGFNFVEAQQQLHDRSLHSTVSQIQTDYGIRVDRVTETIRGYQGEPTRCCRYWLSPMERDKALKLLGMV